MLHDVFVDNVSKHDDEHGPHCTHMRWNCVEDDLHHACAVPKRLRPCTGTVHFVRFFLKSSTSCHTSTGSLGSRYEILPGVFTDLHGIPERWPRLGRRAALCLPRRGATRCLGNRRRVERHRRPRSRSPPSHK